MAITIHTPIAVGLGTVFLTILGAIIFKKIRKEKIPTEWEKVGTVKQLYFFPLKSGKGIKAKELFCSVKGVREFNKKDSSIELVDRSFLIYHKKSGEVRTARQIPKTFLIEIKAAKNGVILSAPNKPDILVNIPKIKKDVTVIFQGVEPFVCTDCGDDVAKWLSNFLLDKDEGLGLGYGDGSSFRNVYKHHKKMSEHFTNMDNNMTGIFSDLAALLVVNQASVDELNKEFSEDQKVSFMNFRPNLLIEGPKAYEEDKWRYIKVGEVIAKACMECLRCIETTVSLNGEMNKQREPLKTLERIRMSKSPFKFGVMGNYLKIIKTGVISEGDTVYVSRDK